MHFGREAQTFVYLPAERIIVIDTVAVLIDTGDSYKASSMDVLRCRLLMKLISASFAWLFRR